MASGIGINGGTGRCYGLWIDFTKCLSDSDLPSECLAYREDYIECLHHMKEGMRNRAILSEVERQEKEKASVAPGKSEKAEGTDAAQ